MALRLNRLLRGVAIVDIKKGWPALQFSKLWQDTVKAIEDAFNDLADQVALIAAAQAAADAAQATADAALAAAGRSPVIVPITSQAASTAAIQLAIDDGDSVSVEAGIRVTAIAGTGTQNVQLEWRVLGGSYASLGALASDSGTAGDTLYPIASSNLTNSSGSRQAYEVRATTTNSGAGALGTIDQPASFLIA